MAVKNTRLLSNPLAVPYIFEGDPAVCSTWIGWATAKLQHMIKSPGSLSCTFIPQEGIEIRVDTKPNKIIIRSVSGTIYLESGFFELLSSAKCSEGTYKPAILHYNDAIDSYIHSVDLPIQGLLNVNSLTGEQLLDGYKSVSVGGQNLRNSITDPCGSVYSSSTAIYTSAPEEILLKKQTQNRVPASMYSGKMRLFVQSLYGSKRKDYKIRVDSAGLPIDYKLYLEDSNGKDVELGWEYPYTCGIFTSDNYLYYLLKVAATDIKIYPLKISSSAQVLRKKLINKEVLDDDISKVEAYILSTAQIDSNNLKTISIIDAPSLGGETLGYGWKFSKSGKKCTIVIHSDTTGGSFTNFLATQLTVEIILDGINFKAKCNIDATGMWQHGLFFAAWRPNFEDYSQMQYGAYNYSQSANFNNTPLYGWYEDEEYKSLNLTAIVTYRTDTVAQQARYVSYGCDATDLTTQSFGIYNGYSGTVALSGLLSSSVKWISSTSYSEVNYAWSSNIPIPDIPTTTATSSRVGAYLCDLGMTGVEYLISIGAWEAAGPYYAIKWIDMGGYYIGKSLIYTEKYIVHDQINRGTVADYGKIALIIPLKDSENITVASKQFKQQSGSNSFYGAREGGNTLTLSTAQLVDVKNVGGTITITGYGAIFEVINNGYFATTSSGTIVANPAAISEEAHLDAYERLGTLFGLNEDGYELKSSLGGSGSANWVNTYTQGTLYEPIANPVVTLSAFNGGTITYNNDISDGSLINGFRNNVPVGWA